MYLENVGNSIGPIPNYSTKNNHFQQIQLTHRFDGQNLIHTYTLQKWMDKNASTQINYLFILVVHLESLVQKNVVQRKMICNGIQHKSKYKS